MKKFEPKVRVKSNPVSLTIGYVAIFALVAVLVNLCNYFAAGGKIC